MPKSNHVHKSMLLRGVKFPPPALNQSDIEATRGRASKTGRSYGGVPLKGDGRGRNSFSFTSSDQHTSALGHQHSYGSQNGYNGSNYPIPPPGWQPPPPGMSGFARGPPPPPPGTYGTYGRGQTQAPPGYSQPSNRGYGGPPGYAGSNSRRPRGGDGYRAQYGGNR